MDDRLKQRLVGAVVLVVAAVVFVPWILDSAEEPAVIVPALPPEVQPPAPVEAPPEDSGTRVVPLDSNAPAASAPAVAPTPKPAPKSAPKPAPKPAAPAPSGFAVQLGSFSKAANARGLRDKLEAKGYTAFVQTEGSVTRVYVGPQKTRAEADKAKKKLLEKAKLKGFVVKL